MATLLAPYNSAMRLGSGFNSYTQTLCINDAVVNDNQNTASTGDLQIQPASRTPTGETCQAVNWKASFVDNASDVLSSMNISGSLAIKIGAVGGARGEGAFLNTDQMQKSDLNYLFQVRVTNQRLVAQNVTKFNVIPNVPAAEFTEVYGDCFISGFLEGGEFNALMSTEVHGKKDILKVSGAISAQFQAGPVEVEATAKGGYDKSDLQKNSTTSISVSWVGGGNIRDTEVEDKAWTMKSMHAAALKFPEKVAKFPQYTHAILTKYTALRSYQELTKKGSPLDYENAGVYTSSLLDAYMEYKAIWADVTNMAREVQAATSTYQSSDVDQTEFEAYADEAFEDYANKYEAYFNKKLPITTKAPPALPAPKDGTPSPLDEEVMSKRTELAKLDKQLVAINRKLIESQRDRTTNRPLKPNPMKVYPPTLIGFDRAKRDCRWEMIKIVNEVDEVANDPRLATDPTRVWMYLDPFVFRQLLPVINKDGPPYTQEWVDDRVKEMLEAMELGGQQLALQTAELEKAQSTIADQTVRLESLTKSVNELEILLDKEKLTSLSKEDLNKTLRLRLSEIENDLLTENLIINDLQSKLDAVSGQSLEQRADQNALELKELRVAVQSLKEALDQRKARGGISYGSLVALDGNSKRLTALHDTSPSQCSLIALSTLRSSHPTKIEYPLTVDVGIGRDNNNKTEMVLNKKNVERYDCNYLTCPSSLISDSGIINFQRSQSSQNVTFKTKYEKPPRVAIWLLGMNVTESHGESLRIIAKLNSITSTKFEVKRDPKLDHAEIDSTWGWCSWSSELDESRIMLRTMTLSDELQNAECHSAFQYWNVQSEFNGKRPLAVLTGITNVRTTRDPAGLNVECELQGNLGAGCMIRMGGGEASAFGYFEAMCLGVFEE